MSDALQDAEALYELLGKSENYVTVKDVLKGTINEIKRLRETSCESRQIQENEIKRLSQRLAAKDIRIQELKEFIKVQSEQFVAGNKQTAELLAKWQQIAIEERANRLAATHVLTGMVPIRSIPATVATVEDHVAGFRERAAKELGLVQEASYVERLEKAFVTMYFETHWRKPDQTYEDQMQEAQAALAKIQEGKE